MNHFSTLFNELLRIIPKEELQSYILEKKTDKYHKKCSSWNVFIAHLFAQIRGKDSLRDIETSLNQQQRKWSHLGIQTVSRSTLSDANKRINPEIFERLFYTFLNKCTHLSAKKKFKFKNPLYALDATVIDLCLSMYDWAKFRKTKGAIKLHCLMDIKGSIPTFMVLTDGKKHDATIAQDVPFPLLPDSIITFDRAYMDFGVFGAYQKNGVFFVTRAKSSLNYTVTGQHPLPKRKGLLFDQEIQLSNQAQRYDYPGKLRLIGYTCTQTGKVYRFLTNNFTLSAATIAQIYKARWEIELFFKWIKQNLKIKSFLGTSKQAVLSQIWVAMIYFLLLSFIKHQTKYRYSLLNLARIIRETLFDRRPLIEILGLKPPDLAISYQNQAQLSLF